MIKKKYQKKKERVKKPLGLAHLRERAKAGLSVGLFKKNI